MTEVSRILVVDDNVATRYSVRRVLEHHGFQVDEAGTGGEGLERLSTEAYDALILDVNLPDMSGFDLVRKLRESPRTSLLPVVHVSAASIATGDMITGLNAGADAYLIHPVDHDVLLATLRTLLRVRKAEEALHTHEARFREIFENISAPIAAVSENLEVRDANPAFRKLMSVAGVTTLRELFGQQSTVELQQALREDRSWNGMFSLQTTNGERITEWRVTPYKERGVGLLYVEDQTEQHAREREHRQQLDSATSELAVQIAERERTEAELQQAMKMDALGKLTGGIAHDFNNMLTGIIGALDMISVAVSSGNVERVPRYAEMAATSAYRAAALTQRMLAFARKQSLDTTAFDVGAQITSLSDLLGRTIGENIALEFDMPREGLVVVADANQLENVVLNLVLNARDAMKGVGRITISARPATVGGGSDVAAGDYVLLSVSDDGPGIPPDIVDKVFEPFFTTKPIGEGTGLGLSMTYGFARQSGGAARIRSAVGDGTTVELLLPRGEAVQAEPEPEEEVAEGGAESILLVDDNEMVRAMAQEVLVEAGYDVFTCSEGTAALDAAGERDFDLLLTDVGLPGMNGRQLADSIRECRPEMPVLFITGYAENAQNRQEFLAEGMEMLPKPFSLNELLRAVRQSLDRRQPVRAG
ncbi:hybrid sensor histidine kinase/response regulator [Stenotrophomonas sp. Marseille-Q4652]|uniref:hybrid sensor histidine kinase/response regulator n=1 Tax=Stenotrophomonas sp. Marseille-Q4652 TaxID=2866595 RepID=UPI001CE3F4CB|nr:hybrid sensor histidine kinase/response regulator [Stenotrophomonas sp. Marseille-Q4652]